MFNKKLINNLPSSPGVYIFKKNKFTIYIGKSVNIKARVKSHIENAKLDQKENMIVTESNTIEIVLTDSDFNALLMETELIQKYQPKYNTVLKDDKSQLYIEITIHEKYPKILLNRKKNLGKNNLYFGPFHSLKTASTLLKEIRKIIPFCTQPKIGRHPCFYSKIKLCDPCPNTIQYLISDIRYKKILTKQYKKQIREVIKILKRKGENVLKGFYRDLKEYIINNKFEEAIILRDKILKLETLTTQQKIYENDIIINYDNSVQSIELLCEVLRKFYPRINNLRRIECFDMSNLNQQQTTASMVVFIDGRMDKSEYKRFKIKDIRLKSDTKYIEEVITRRFKNNWGFPQLLVIDGGKPQVTAVLKVLNKLELVIPVLGIAKRPDRLIIGIEKLKTIYLANNHAGLNLIRALRDEAHRFAKKYHILLREKELLYN